jgi:DNA polymerase
MPPSAPKIPNVGLAAWKACGVLHWSASMVNPEANTSAVYFFPSRKTLPALRKAAAGCRACELWKIGTQTVFGEGKTGARIVLIGEQPGDEEDQQGEPFVGPAGRLLDDALAEAGIDRAATYVTNVVKHFKWQPRGKRRIHQKPNSIEVNACLPWLTAEIAVAKPQVIVCLGATAAKAILGKSFRVLKQRGQFVESPLAPYVCATVHPSSILRTPDEAARRGARRHFVDDLRRAGKVLS